MSVIVYAGGKTEQLFRLAPGAKDNYTIDFTDYLQSGQTLSDVTMTADSGLTVSGKSVSSPTVDFYVEASATARGRLYIRALPDKGSGVGNPIALVFQVGLPRDA